MTERWALRHSGHTVFGVGITSLFVAVLLIATIPASASWIDTAERSIDRMSLAPGESTNITVEVEMVEPRELALTEAFDPAFADVSIVDADPKPTSVTVSDSRDEFTAHWDEYETVMIQYEVTVPEDADPGDSFNFTGLAEVPEEGHWLWGDERIEVVERASFSGSITDTNAPVEGGEPLNVTATIENTGDREGSQTVVLLIDDTERDAATVTLKPNESATVRFEWKTGTDDAGNYTATVASMNDTATVPVTVEPAESCIDEAVAGEDGFIALAEIQQALDWWANGEPVLGTGGETLSLSKIQELIDAWANDIEVEC